MNLFILFLVTLCAVLQSNAFQTVRPGNPTFEFIEKTSLLKTAGGSKYVRFIPRLEPGLRILRSSKYAFSSVDPGQLSTFSLDILSQAIVKSPKLHTGIYGENNGYHRENIENQLSVDSLFGTAKDNLAQFSLRFYSYVKKIVASSFIFLSTWNSNFMKIPNIKRVATVASGVVSAALGGPRLAGAGIANKKYKQLSPSARLATTPLYYVSNARGHAYLQEDVLSGGSGASSQKVIVYFMSSEDAQDYLEEMAQSNALNAQDFHLMTTNFEKVIDQIAAKKQSRKLGRYPVDLVYRIQPSSKQLDNAVNVQSLNVGHSQKKKYSKANVLKDSKQTATIPMFSAQGMVIQRANGETITPYYFALEDLQADWQKMVESRQDNNNNNNIPATPNVVVRDFTFVMCLANGIGRHVIEGQGKDFNKQLIYSLYLLMLNYSLHFRIG
jgi:hypothetical protein